MSAAENSPALLARRAAQFVELSVTDGTGYRYDSYWQRVHLGILPNESELEVIQRTSDDLNGTAARWGNRSLHSGLARPTPQHQVSEKQK
jgi:hypothetical protein